MPHPIATSAERMTLVEALEVLHAVRRDEVVVTTMGNAREWQKLGKNALDLIYVPSSMGQGTSLALGIALAQPERKVVVCNGDGSMLMNLGSLVTITAQAPTNLIVIVFDNGVYEITGSQPTPAAPPLRQDAAATVDFGALASACGFQHVWAYRDINDWRENVTDLIDGPGPVFV